MSIKLGDYVSIPHSLSFMPDFMGKREYGVVHLIDGDDYHIVFPIGDDDPRVHSQAVPYEEGELRVETREEALKHLPSVWASVPANELVYQEAQA